MVELLRRRGVAPERIHVFSADGEDPAADLTTRDTTPPDFWLIEDTGLGNRLKPSVQLTDTSWRAVKLHPARLADLRQWFDAAQREILPGDRLLVFVTDHGGPGRSGPGSGMISLWHEQLTVRELRLLLDRLAPKVQVVTVMSQCYSGAFADLMYDGGASAPPSGNTCGFFATTADDKAYGCYPEGQDRDRVGYAFELIDALNRQSTVTQAHNQVMQSDSTPDRPRRTSDAYLSRLLSDEARARGTDRDDLADSLLKTAWRDAAAWEPDIRRLDAIGEAFGTFSPRSLREVKSGEQDLVRRADELKTYLDRWNAVSLEAKESLLRAFAASHPMWRDQLDPRAVEPLPPDQRAALVARFLDELHPFARQSDLWPKVERFRAAASRASEASWRFEVRKAAAERMRTILLTVAGRELLTTVDDRRSPRDEARAAQRQALDALVQCEALNPGDLPAKSVATVSTARASFPPLSDDIDLLQQLQPSWLGVRYAPVPAALRTARPALAGAAQIQSVEDGSPAEEAGLQPTDVVLGPPGQPFKSSAELRDWTMTAPQGVALPLKTVRLGTSDSTNGGEFEAMIVLRPLPGGRRESGLPPRLGTPAPALPDTLKSARGGDVPDLKGREHLLFFWATWCVPCKAALPEVMAFAEAKGMPALAITDEEQATVAKFLDGWTRPFFESVAVDSYRQTFISYAISGTPTIVLVDAGGVIRHRQVGYSVKDGLKVDGWRWSGR